MTASDFQQELYQDLDEKLRASPWKSGVSEAHGLLTGLACRATNTTEVRNKIHLFQITEKKDALLLEGLFELILRDLNSEEPTFHLLLPEQQTAITGRADAIANWCGGFIQGFCHDSDSLITENSEDIQELLGDIMDISGIQIEAASDNNEEDEKSLFEIEEYLKVGVQLIYDQSIGTSQPDNPVSNQEIH